MARMFANVFIWYGYETQFKYAKTPLICSLENSSFLPQMVNGVLGQIGLPAQQLVERESG
jgi:hypothetical protein